MNNWLSAAFSAAAGEAQRRLGAAARSVAFWVVGFLLALVAIGWLGAAAYTALKGVLGPVPAQLIMAGVFVLLAVLSVVLASVSTQSRTAPPPAAADQDWEAIAGSRRAGLPTIAAAFAFGLARGLLRRRRR